VLTCSIDERSTSAKSTLDLQKRFELGDESVNLHDEMISLQKASLSFQTMVQVRNKLVTAYQEIMNTQV
jgi:flagellar hook-basal body complex protein FliE